MKAPNSLTGKVKHNIVLKEGLFKYASFLSTIIIFLFCAQVSTAQITITPSDDITTKTYLAGQNFDITISATATNGNPVSLSVSSDINAASGLQFDNTNPAAGTPLHLHGNNPVASPTALDWGFELIATATGEAATPASFIVKIRKPIDLFLVLDKSGSMNTLVTGSASSRFSTLQNGVNSFFSIYKPKLTTVANAAGDQLGIRFFSTTDVGGNAPYNAGFAPVTSSTDLTGIFTGFVADGSTAMGPAVLSAGTLLFPGGVDNGHKKAMLVFTDGEQNTPADHSQDVVANPGFNPAVAGTDVSNGDKIKIHTIGLGIAGSATQTLYNMAHETGGITNIPDGGSTTAPKTQASELLQAYNDISTALLQGATPQYVDVKRSRFKSLGTYFGADDTFTVSKKIDLVILSVLSEEVNESSARVMSIEKGGEKLPLFDTSVMKFSSGFGWQTFVISVSKIKKKIPAFTSEGNWIVHLMDPSQTGLSYIASLIVDDQNSEMEAKTAQTKELVVGDALPLSIELTKAGKPITGATAFAIVAKPGEDLGDLLARTRADVSIDTAGDADNPGTQKLQQLLKDSAFAKKLLDDEHRVNLIFNATQKKYVGEFKQLDVSGVYQVAYFISVVDAALDTIKRFAEESVYIRFPEVNLDSSGINLTATANGGTLVFRPIGVNGKFVGPGWGKDIKITGGTVKIANIVDNLDGSYVLTLEGPLTDDVTVSIGTAQIYKGKLDNIGKGGGVGNEIFKQWWFWLILIIILIIIWLVTRKKKP